MVSGVCFILRSRDFDCDSIPHQLYKYSNIKVLILITTESRKYEICCGTHVFHMERCRSRRPSVCQGDSVGGFVSAMLTRMLVFTCNHIGHNVSFFFHYLRVEK